MRKIFLTFSALFLFLASYNQEIVEPSLVKWYTIEEGFELYEENPKPIIIDVYTDWCGWCKHMMKTTFASQGLSNYINSNFIPIRFDAETKDTIVYKDSVYINSGKTHDLAIELLDNRLSYPTIVYFDRQGNKNPVPGYMDVQDIEPLLVFFAEDLQSYVNYQDFNSAYMYTYPKVYAEKIKELPENTEIDTTGTVNWITFEEAIEKSKEEKKPFIIDFYVSWCNSCKIMKTSAYKNSVIANYINENFYPISFNAAETATVTLNGTEYKSLGENQPHQLAMAILQGNFAFPSTVFMNSEFEVISSISGYYAAKQFEPIIKFYATESYKTTDFQTFFKDFEPEIN